eukprot:CAMPEP_0182546462 /NCGR_PEP_ID=MMETSP1323-20130603/36065_1 /TAXON_ID=236787 /ORGANISM="Florenciella parvula, Strain RCC1693" /LENGTH=159 /DNA_ID=CAMNT_0024757691 /DNA_START=17 /DNA_END=496 /DNA_ORIENTATION=-
MSMLRFASHARSLATAGAISAVLYDQQKPTQFHCQVPCGIFDDPSRVSMLQEDVATIKKAMAKITELSSDSSVLSLNQSVRWVNTKEEHACKIIDLVANYMLSQRVKKELFASEHDYHDALEFHHKVMQLAMKSKQTVDPAAAEALESAIEDLSKMYTK